MPEVYIKCSLKGQYHQDLGSKGRALAVRSGPGTSTL